MKLVEAKYQTNTERCVFMSWVTPVELTEAGFEAYKDAHVPLSTSYS